MNAEAKIRKALEAVMDNGDINAAHLFKGFAVDNGMTGWQLRRFGRSDHIFLGSSVQEALETTEDWASANER